MSLPPEHANLVHVVKPSTVKMKQVEATIELITKIKEGKLARGLVLNPEMVSKIGSGRKKTKGKKETNKQKEYKCTQNKLANKD